MFCKNCGSEIAEGSLFCNNCGIKIQEAEQTDLNLTTENPEEVTKGNRVSEKATNIVNKITFGTIIVGLVGAVLFLGIVLVGLFSEGEVYLFDGYDYVKVLSTISIVLMMIGVCGVVAKLLLVFVFKIGKFPKAIVKRILIITLAVCCLGFSIWGFVDCSSNANYDYFYKLYAECGCAYPWADCDSSYLSIDTNPFDYDDDSSYATRYASDAVSAIKKIHSKLKVPSYVYEEMINTRALDGIQTWSGKKINISWRYHPDRGLEIRYTR